MQLAEENNVTYKNERITSDVGVRAELQLLIEGDNAKVNQRDFDLISKFVSDNYLQVL